MGNLRVIGGERRGFPLRSPRGGELRPTSNRVREALFDILGDKVRGSRFLDLFAGTGAVGIEALSRGASECRFIESEPRHARLIRENLRFCRLEESAEIMQGILPSCLSAPGEERSFDLVFVDPPYETSDAERLLKEIVWERWLATGAWLILEHPARRSPAAHAGSLRHLRTVRYGDSALSFFSREGALAGAKKV